MEKKNKSGLLVGILIGIIIMLLVVIALFATGTIGFKANTTTNNIEKSNEVEDTNINSNEEETKELTDEAANNILKERAEKVFKYVHSMGAYCGETEPSYPDNTQNYDKEKFIVDGYIVYFKSSFKNKDELYNYMRKFMNDEVIKKYSKEGKYTVETYKEQNGSLFCLNSNKDCGTMYDSEKSTFTIINKTDNLINATVEMRTYSCGDYEKYLTTTIELLKENDNWVVTKYEEQ